jgi:hypothetical protein
VALRLLDLGGVDVDAKDSRNGTTPLLCACVRGLDAVALRLLDIGGVDVDAKDSTDGTNVLYWACANDLATVAARIVAIQSSGASIAPGVVAAAAAAAAAAPPAPPAVAASTGTAASAPPASSRVCEDLTPDGALAPISGVKRMPLVSLDEAIASSGLDGVVSIASLPGMLDISDCVFVATAKAEELIASDGPDRFGLSADHIAALNLYTQDAMYSALNAALRAADRATVKPYFSYLRLFLDALRLLPAHHPHGDDATVFRGVNKDLGAHYPDGKKVFFWSVTSCTTDGAMLSNPKFLGTTGARTMLNITTPSSRDISRYSSYPSEAEVVLPPGLQFQVMSKTVLPGSGGLVLINLTETSSRLVPWVE